MGKHSVLVLTDSVVVPTKSVVVLTERVEVLTSRVELLTRSGLKQPWGTGSFQVHPD